MRQSNNTTAQLVALPKRFSQRARNGTVWYRCEICEHDFDNWIYDESSWRCRTCFEYDFTTYSKYREYFG